jgi:hypothetical protein
MRKIYVFLILFPIAWLNCSAQMSAGIALMGTNYQGDLAKGIIDTKETNIGFGAFVRRSFQNRKWAMKATLNHGMLMGNDANYPDRKKRGLSFSSPITQAGFAVEWSPFAKSLIDVDGYFVKQTNIYGSLGFGISAFNPSVKNLPIESPERSSTYSKATLTIPVGAGIRFDLAEDWTVGLEANLFYPFTDYLDGVSQSAMGTNKDWYLFYGVTLAYKWAWRN